MIMADLKEAMEAPPTTISGHTHALAFLYEHPRDPENNEAGTDWIYGASAHLDIVVAPSSPVFHER